MNGGGRAARGRAGARARGHAGRQAGGQAGGVAGYGGGGGGDHQLKERRAAANVSNTSSTCLAKVRAEPTSRHTLLGHAHMREALGRHSNMKYR